MCFQSAQQGQRQSHQGQWRGRENRADHHLVITPLRHRGGRARQPRETIHEAQRQEQVIPDVGGHIRGRGGIPGHIGYGELIRIAEIERGIEPNHVPRHQRRHDENGGNDYRQRRAQRLQRLDAACAQTGAQRANLRPEQGERKQCGQGERRSASEIRRNAQGAQGQSWQGERLGIARLPSVRWSQRTAGRVRAEP